ncbi:FKBP-type peptidyl-prolyl cis-trans isomerase [Novosphingobium album (ex Liu et al. 2023)]|uniref:Peptidyl-prolyl cis-trans isomerase n=1 Tax=Novosphingobium album (ex Liu et al. 2023) TaxID=3031130 RepID=A0ABT5WRF7_9SPHN|nr:FKBP-type peptidyl-prolyl cis-trans isomerase [Novosphingobium album (ex Liu et al. 2023)]MDE8652626.1 FKBP-type peptidyl-prolyl cis-trans isomerase [Novosphingobium album (ex Liu et al. 2023)]
MTEITRVPLQPIAKGALTKVWLGVAAIALAAGGIAWAALPPAVDVETITPGAGDMPTRDDVALVNYKGSLPDGKVFDEGKQAIFPLSEVVPGFTKALEQMQRGGKYKVEIPSELAYGDKQMGEIPPNTDLTFEIELLDFKSRQEIEQQQRMMQQLQQMQMQGAGGAAGAVPGEMPPPGEAPAQP